MLWETLKLAWQALRRNVLRSMLTVLGIVIGVGAVIGMVTIGNGTTAKVAADLARLGSNLLTVRPGQFGPGRKSSEAKPFNIRDIEALRGQLGQVRAVSGVSSKAVTIVYGTENRVTPVFGTDNGYFIAQAWNLKAGRQFLEGEVRSGRAVCIIGDTVRDKLFGPSEYLGRSIRVNRVSCEVIGLLEARGQSGFGTDLDDIVVMPLRAFQRRLAGTTDIATVLVSAAEAADTAKVQADIEWLLRERRGITPAKEDDFSVRDMKQIAETQIATTAVLTQLLGAVDRKSVV